MQKVFRTILAILVTVNFISAQDSLHTIQIKAVGDIMLGTDFPKSRLPLNDGEYLLKDVYGILNKADITIGNYEGVLLDGGTPRKKCNDPTKCYLYRTPTVFVKNLVKAGFDIMSIANNHANDFGSEGVNSTKNILRENGIKFSGPIGEIVETKVDSISVGFIAFSTSPGNYSILNISCANEEVKSLSERNDIVIVSFHGGAEGSKALHVKDEMEIAYGERRGNLIRFAHSVIDAGADLVIGHGPHVPRALELYKGKLIAYSLGNFCTYKGFSVVGHKGLAPVLNVEIAKDGNFVSGKIISARQERPYGPVPDKEKKVYNLIRELTQEDFPETKLIFNEDGTFFPTN